MFNLYLTTLIFGLIPVLGRALTIPAEDTVFGRSFFATISLAFILCIFRLWEKIPNRSLMLLVFSGALLCIHWVAFFHSLSISTVLIGEVSFSSYPFFTVLLTPLILKKPFLLKNMIGALGIIIGVVIMCTPLNESFLYWEGLCWGIFSAFLFAILTIINQKLRQDISSLVLTFYQNLIVALCLCLFSFKTFIKSQHSDLLYLLLLGVVGTAGAHTLYNYCLKSIRPDVVALVIGVSPAIAVLFGWLLLREEASSQELVGMIVIIASGLFTQLEKRQSKFLI